MRKILHEIHSQPAHIRELFMWLCVVITFSVIGFVWFRSTSRQFVALMNPKTEQERVLAQKPETRNQKLATRKLPSPLATILTSWRNLQANISELFVGPKSNLEINNGISGPEKPVPAQKLPISE